MKYRPIIYNAESVRAILDGRMTQTRRVIKPQPKTPTHGTYPDPYNGGPEWAFWLPDNRMTEPRTWRCPYGQPGDRLWVRETWARDGFVICYRADGTWVPRTHDRPTVPRWRSAIHMPRWASRLTLEVTDVRVERVQDISEWDCQHEGIWKDILCSANDYPWIMGDKRYLVAQGAFRALWDSINAKRGFGWDVNPWVWVLTFRMVDDA